SRGPQSGSCSLPTVVTSYFSFFFFQAEDGIRDPYGDWSSDVCSSDLEREMTWTWEEFRRLPRVTVRSDIHCETRWSKLDNEWEGVSARWIMEQVKPRPKAKWVLQHADQIGRASCRERVELWGGGVRCG